jgi:hypothetical protein
MKHKHADLIHAWADGAQIQWLDSNYDWCNIACTPAWSNETTYRIKPEPKPDMYKYVDVRAVRDGICQWATCLPEEANLGLIFDGETKQLKSAKVMK